MNRYVSSHSGLVVGLVRARKLWADDTVRAIVSFCTLEGFGSRSESRHG